MSIIITIGAAVLGKVGGEMIITDPWVHKTFHPPHWLDIAVQVFFVIGVVVLGKYLLKRKIAKQERELEMSESAQAEGDDLPGNEPVQTSEEG